MSYGNMDNRHLNRVLLREERLFKDINFVILIIFDQDIITQWLIWRLATGEVLGSNPNKGDNLFNF